MVSSSGCSREDVVVVGARPSPAVCCCCILGEMELRRAGPHIRRPLWVWVPQRPPATGAGDQGRAGADPADVSIFGFFRSQCILVLCRWTCR